MKAVPGQSHSDMPLKRLLDFRRLVDMSPSETRSVSFGLNAAQMKFSVSAKSQEAMPEAVTISGPLGPVEVEIGDVVNPSHHRFVLT